MAIAPNGSAGDAAILIFENDPHQAIAYRELFTDAGYIAETALPSQDVQQLCERLRPAAVLFDMAIWEADTAYVFGVLNGGLGFEREREGESGRSSIRPPCAASGRGRRRPRPRSRG